jgi:fatty-acyl-CoA synthase
MDDDLDRYLPPLSEDVRRARRQSIGSLLARTALKYGAKLAVVHRDTRRTFAELDADANRVANALAAREVVRNQRVAIYAHNSYAFVVAYFALARLGAISVPVNFNFVASEVRYVLQDSGATAVIVEEPLVDTLGAAEVPIALGVVIGRRIGWTSFDRLLEHDDATAPDVEIGDDDPVQLLYTSGTTSAPKGAIMTSRNLIAQYVSDIVDGEYHRDDVELHALPLYHCAALHDFLTPDVYLGATSVVVDVADPETILRTVEAERITKMFCPPTVWIRLLRSPAFDRYDLSSLRKGYYGAAIMPVAVLEELGRRLPDIRRGRPTRAGRAGRRDRAPDPARHAWLLGQARGDRRGLPPRLVPQRGSRRDGRRRLPDDRRPQEGHHHHRR